VLNEVRSNVVEVQLAQVSSEPELIGVIAFRQTSCARSSVFRLWLAGCILRGTPHEIPGPARILANRTHSSLFHSSLRKH